MNWAEQIGASNENTARFADIVIGSAEKVSDSEEESEREEDNPDSESEEEDNFGFGSK